MGNLHYCRFENTYNDLLECEEALAEGERLSESEFKYRNKLIKLCKAIAADFDETEYTDEGEDDE